MPALRFAAVARRGWMGAVFLMAAWCSIVLLNFVTTDPTLSPAGDRLSPCPPSPNCVCSHDTDPRAAIDPLVCPGPTSATQELGRLRELIRRLPRTRLIDERPGYLRFVVTTPIFRFRDDLELLADDAAKVIHIRSASRLGYSDLGTNRRRVEMIRRLFLAAGAH